MTRREILRRLAIALAPLAVGCKRKWPQFPSRVENGVIMTDGYDVQRWQIEMRRVVARSLPETGYSNCDSCNLPWWVVEGHTVMFEDRQGCFPVCEMCFRALRPEESLPFYVAHVEKYYPGDEAKIKRLREELFAGGYIQPVPNR